MRPQLVIVEVVGGLGNQMFQVAAGWSLARRCGAELKLDLRHYDTPGSRTVGLANWSLDVAAASRAEIRAVRRDDFPRRSFRRAARAVGRPFLDVYIEPHFHFDPRFDELTAPIYLHGYFQSPRYFAGWEAEVRSLFTLRDALSDEAEAQRRELEALPCPVALHVRRGDYTGHPRHGTLDRDYYRRAIAIVDEETSSAATYVVFSDDPAQAREMLDGLDRLTFAGGTRAAHEDLFLMSLCDHAIVANSTFSWWAAWLNPSPGKRVVAPKAWVAPERLATRNFADLFPPSWTVI